MVNQSSQGLPPHVAILQSLARYSRGIDRRDRRMIESAYWPDAQDDHIAFVGSIPDFADWILEHLRTSTASSHFLGQSLITVNGARAEVETYYTAWTQFSTPTGELLRMAIGRYLDQFEEREGEWRVLNRKVLLDIVRDTSRPLAEGTGNPPGPWAGRPSADDASYTVLSTLV